MKLTRYVSQVKCAVFANSDHEGHEESKTRLEATEAPVVAIKFQGALVTSRSVEALGSPLPGSLWALRVFCYNGWETTVVTTTEDIRLTQEWVNRHARELVTRVVSWGSQVYDTADLVVDSRCDHWIGRILNWAEIMECLRIRGLLHRGLLPREEGSMLEILEDHHFSEYMEEVRYGITYPEEDADAVQELERHALETIEAVSTDRDRVYRALTAGRLLGSLLRLLTRQRFDPLGCLLLAQQDKKGN